jgi:hypothetical protein
MQRRPQQMGFVAERPLARRPAYDVLGRQAIVVVGDRPLQIIQGAGAFHARCQPRLLCKQRAQT